MEVLHVRNQKVADTPTHRVYAKSTTRQGGGEQSAPMADFYDRESPVRVSGRSPSASV